MSVPPPAPALAGRQRATWGSCPGVAGSSEGDATGGEGAGGQRCAPAGGTAHARELPQKCTFSVVSPSHGAGCSRVLTGARHPHRHCREPALPLRGASRADGTLGGTYWHCVREQEGFWQGLGLLPGASRKTYIIKRTLFNKVLVGRRARRLLSVQLHFPQGTISGKPQAPHTEVGADSPPFPGPQWLGPSPSPALGRRPRASRSSD